MEKEEPPVLDGLQVTVSPGISCPSCVFLNILFLLKGPILFHALLIIYMLKNTKKQKTHPLLFSLAQPTQIVFF